jgi:hypothetical protein
MTTKPMNFVKWNFLFLITYATLTVIFVALVDHFLHSSFGQLLRPMALLFGCGVLFSLLVYWALRSRGRPEVFPVRFALGSFVYLQLFAVVIGFGASRVGVVSQSTLLHDYFPALLPGAVVTSAVIYLWARKRSGHPSSTN